MRVPSASRRPSLAVDTPLAGILLLLGLMACTPAPRPGSLRSTLIMEQVDGGLVAVQNAIPVPTFDVQGRPLSELSGAWRVERQQLEGTGAPRLSGQLDWGTSACDRKTSRDSSRSGATSITEFERIAVTSSAT